MTQRQVVWVVGRCVGDTWELQGIYSGEEFAQQNAQPGWFVGPVDLDVPLPEATTEWAGAYVAQILSRLLHKGRHILRIASNHD